MTDWKDRLEGSISVKTATVMLVGASSIQLVASNPSRLSLTLQSAATAVLPMNLGYGSTAVASQSPPVLAPGGGLEEAQWTGAVNACVPTGTHPVYVLELNVGGLT